MKFKMMRPTVDTQFQIEWSWFEQNKLDEHSVVRNQLNYKWRQRFDNGLEVQEVDYIDPETGEVFRMNNLHEAILAECQWEPDYITRDMPLSQSILRLFLANNNQPMSVVEMARRLERHDSQAILRVLINSEIQNGIIQVR
ncbi:MAG: hypothetical protein ACPGWR_16820 [Ardenticatenaceae bacterium]